MRAAALMIVATLLVPSFTTSATVAPAKAGEMDALRKSIKERGHLRLDPSGTTVRSLRLPAPAPNRSVAGLPALLIDHAAAFGLQSPSRELVLETSRKDRFGRVNETYAQVSEGIPVLGGSLRLHLNDQGFLIGITSRLVPSVQPNAITPSVSLEQAKHVARASGHEHSETQGRRLVVLRTGLLRGMSGGDDRLAWEVTRIQNNTEVENVYVDALRGVVIEKVPLLVDIDRVIHHQTYPNPIWSEGDDRPVTGYGALTNEEAETLIETANDTYELFANLSGGTYLSWAGDDRVMHSVVDLISDSCPNAWWNGHRTNYCPGMATDDIAAHEWTHAYTQATHSLIYLWQSGALNEAYSDIFGETVDLLNGHGFDEPGGIRTPGACSAYSGGQPSLTVTQPASVSGAYTAGGALFNPEAPWSAEGQVEIVPDGSGGVGEGCSEITGFTPGNIAMLKFGSCLFFDPARNAQQAGASGVIVVNPFNDSMLPMIGSATLEIPTVMIGRTAGEALIDAANQGELVARIGSAEASARWLVGEDSTLGTLRDMWVPQCENDPGAVTDEHYWCDLSGDNGGVHSNSGVPNRAYAQLVDGGEVRGYEVPAIGITKAAHIYWRAMTVYQLPISDFSDHADALEASCADLTGAVLTDLQTGEPSPEVIGAQDCAAVSAAIQAVGLRETPPCGFATVLDPNHPASRREVFHFDESFATSPTADWTFEDEGVFDDYYEPRSWVWSDNAPDGADGGTMFAASDPNVEDCNFPMQAGRVSLTTPAIVLPPGTRDPMLLVDHYVATPAYPWGFGDGGNLKISVNGGDFDLLAPEAFAFNSYPGTLIEVDENSATNPNPLAGEPAFLGINDGFFEGSWGQSQINLDEIAGAGDEIRIRFDFGTDGCAGLDGWYLDRVQVVSVSPVREGGDRAP